MDNNNNEGSEGKDVVEKKISGQDLSLAPSEVCILDEDGNEVLKENWTEVLRGGIFMYSWARFCSDCAHCLIVKGNE